jgi:hypothetical protein
VSVTGSTFPSFPHHTVFSFLCMFPSFNVVWCGVVCVERTNRLTRVVMLPSYHGYCHCDCRRHGHCRPCRWGALAGRAGAGGGTGGCGGAWYGAALREAFWGWEGASWEGVGAVLYNVYTEVASVGEDCDVVL